MAADKSDEPGVLGNLPRSRPGHRSAKRGGSRAAAKPAPTATATTGANRASKPRSAREPASARKPASSRKPASARKPAALREPAAPARSGPGDPLTGAVRLAGKVAEAGLKTAGELLRRLPGR